MRCCILLRPGQTYRPDAFVSGAKRLGYEVLLRPIQFPREADVLVIWNRSRSHDPLARKFEEAGASVVIVENGPCGSDKDGHKLYSLSLSYHNGAGWHRAGAKPRFEIPLQPWREAGEHILVLPQRGIGSPPVAMPYGWLARTLKAIDSKRAVKVRHHPGAPKTAPDADLRGAHCVVTWASGAGIKAMLAGIPAFYDFPQWIGRSAACSFHSDVLEYPCMGDRAELVRQLSWLQWRLPEISSGEALEWLLHDHR